MKAFGELSSSQRARRVGLVTIGTILVVLVIFLMIAWLTGDTTDDLKERQPTPAPETTATP